MGSGSLLYSALAAGLAALAVLTVALGLRPQKAEDPLLARIDDSAAVELPEPTIRGDSAWDRLLGPALRGLLQQAYRLAPRGGLDRLRRELAAAGYSGGLRSAEFLGLQIVLAASCGVLGLGLLPALSSRLPVWLALVTVILLFVFGYRLPRIWLHRQMQNRQHRILRSLPDALDMLTVAVDAGLGLDGAMVQLSERWRDELSQEFGRVIAEVRVGLPRRQALLNLAERCDIPDVTSFVGVLVQAEQLGLSIAQVLHTQAQQIRLRRRQRVEENAHKAPLKMLFPLVFFIFPALFVVLLGPAVVDLIAFFGTVNR